MSRSRSLTGLLLLALGLGFAATGLVATSASAAGEKLIQGVVVDQGGRPVLGVTVVAVGADGANDASDLSYENTDASGDPQRGYFALHVSARGTYSVKLSKSGYTSAVLSDVKVVRGHLRVSLGEVTLKKKLVETATTGKLVDGSITTADKGKVKVTVAPAAQKPTGDVVVKAGKQVLGSAVLKASNKGVVTVTLKKLDKGSYDLKVSYAGTKFLKDSTSAKLTLKVTRPAGARPVPNALAYVG